MFLLDLTYLQPMEQIQCHLKEHIQFLEQYYAKRLFVCSGEKADTTGELILANGIGMEQVFQITQQDPFCQQNLVEYKITEFYPTGYAQGFDIFIGV